MILAFVGWLTTNGCGGLDTSGAGATPNDATPNGTVVAQGTFWGQGQTVSGTAIVYQVGSGNYILRLQSISVPAQSGLTVQLNSSAATVARFTLRSTTGTQNYRFSSAPVNFISTNIISTTSNNTVIGSALMSST